MIVAIDNKGVNVINKLNDASGGLTVMTRSDLRSYIENSLTGRVKSRPNLTQRFTRPAFTGLKANRTSAVCVMSLWFIPL